MKQHLILSVLLISGSMLNGAETIAPVSGATDMPGHRDGTGGVARFNDPMGLARDA